MSTRWVSWRRDLLFALAGVLVASAVLVPVGLWYRQRTEEAATMEALMRAEHERAIREAAEAKAARAAAQRLADEAALREIMENQAATEAPKKAVRPQP